jgi:SWIM zinc finger
MPYTFADLITHQSLQEFAGPRIYQRGVTYWEDHLVENFNASKHLISAQVQGTELYDVELWIEAEGDGLESFCDCLSFEDGDFCKHCVAVGLTWLAHNQSPPPPVAPVPGRAQKVQARSTNPAQTNQDLDQVKLSLALKGQTAEQLIELILDRAKADTPWRQQLLEQCQGETLVGAPLPALARPVPASRTIAAPVPQAPEALWPVFVARPHPRAYQQLKQAADPRGTWGTWKEKAIAHLIERADQIDQQMSRSGRQFGIEPGREVSMLVECLLWEGDGQRAFKEARKGHCTSYTWLKIADNLRLSQPEDALSIYMMNITSVMQESNNAAYQETYRLLGIIQDLMLKLELRSQFQRYILSLEKIYSSKRSFKSGLSKFK